jgi:N6-L-threonylcarbamoyladenine synthase
MKPIIILGIESSCDDTAASIVKDGVVLSNVIANQDVHKQYGGVIPELASRAHQQNIIPVINQAIEKAKITKNDISGIAFTRGPGLMGSLLVGVSFAKAMAMALDIPMIEVNHMQGHILAHFILETENNVSHPKFPFLCLTVSGGHTQIVKVTSHYNFDVIGETTDDAAGEAFDKVAKILGLPYPGGPLVDKYAKLGNPSAFKFVMPNMPDLNFSFSGLKTNFLNFINKQLQLNPQFINDNRDDICASIQYTIINILMNKLKKAAEEHNITEIAIAGGVSANSGLREALMKLKTEIGWNIYIPKFEYCTDNAAMIAITGYFKYLNSNFSTQNITASPRFSINEAFL